MYIESFHKIVQKYKIIFFDSFGVLKNSSGLIPGAASMVKRLVDADKRCIVLTNDASRSESKLISYYQAQGLHEFSPQDVVSSGMLARHYLWQRIKTGKVAYIGTENSAEHMKQNGLQLISIDDVLLPQDTHTIRAMVFLDDEGFDWQQSLNKVLNILRQSSIPVIVANTDFTYPSDKDLLSLGVGSLAHMMESILGRKFIRFGKPDSQIFQYAFEHVARSMPISKEDVLMVGDTLTTDILGAHKFGIDSALVLTGNTIPDQASYLIKTLGVAPTYICESIAHQNI